MRPHPSIVLGASQKGIPTAGIASWKVHRLRSRVSPSLGEPQPNVLSFPPPFFSHENSGQPAVNPEHQTLGSDADR